MEDEEAQQRDGDDPDCHRADDDHHCRVDFVASIRNGEDDHVDEEGQDGEHHSSQKRNEESVVPFPNAIIHEGAVMIKHFYTISTTRTMTSTRRSIDMAGLAISSDISFPSFYFI